LPGNLTPLLHERLVQVGTVARSFEEGAAIFLSFTRTTVSEPTARRYTERSGAVMEECEAEGRPPAAPAPADPRPIWVGADGAFLRLVGKNRWREVRTVTIGRVNPSVSWDGEEQVTTSDMSYFSRLTEGAEAFIDLAAVEFCRRKVAAARLVGAGADGADWCQNLFQRHCPQAICSLDFYHGAVRVVGFSKVLWAGNPGLASWYAQEQLHGLKHHGPERLLASLAVWTNTSDVTVCAAASAQHAFFSSRRQLLDYPAVRKAGLPIGTGNAESANRHVMQDRLKGPGKFWGQEHVNPMLALRGAWCSHRWDQAWGEASKRLAAGHYPVRLFHAPKLTARPSAAKT
jgi:hypothetical protein